VYLISFAADGSTAKLGGAARPHRFPRATSLDRLPDVYRKRPRPRISPSGLWRAVRFLNRGCRHLIERYPALLDPAGVPEQVLPWLGGFFGIGFDPHGARIRDGKFLQQAPELYRLRGTAAVSNWR